MVSLATPRRSFDRLASAMSGRYVARTVRRGLVATEVIEAYDRLLATGGCAKDQAESVLGDAELVRALTERAMAHIQPHWLPRCRRSGRMFRAMGLADATVAVSC